jgi:hypothetical protein
MELCSQWKIGGRYEEEREERKKENRRVKGNG